jgi:hypothetical protein
MSGPHRFEIGDVVYARWFGLEPLVIERRAKVNSPFPHWICKSWGGRRNDFWVIPQIHLSIQNITILAKDNNRKQPSLPL